MEWNVFYYNMNARKIETFNIFNHGSFNKYVKEAIKTYKTKEEFAKQLETELLYYFWCKAEYELLFSPWVGGDIEDGKKIDVYTQVMANFDILLDYIWENKDNV